MLALFLALPAHADQALDSFARDVDRTESVRAVKTLQHSYAQYAQYGLWNEVGALFTRDGSFTFDGLVKPAQTAKGPVRDRRLPAYALRRRPGGADARRPLEHVHRQPAGESVRRTATAPRRAGNALIFHGHGGKAQIEGGIFENDYVREGGVWKFAAAHYFPQFDGPYEEGWINWGGGDLPVVPHHFDIDTAGIPIPPATGTAPQTRATLAELQQRVDAMNDEDRVRNLQAAYGYYADRKMWDDVVDLFAKDGVVEIGGQGIWRGPASIRRWFESMGPAGLTHGQLNDRVQFDMIVTIAPGGNEAWARGIELGMLGEADQEKGWWEVATFRNRFVKESGVWKIREMRRFPLMKTDIFLGWGKSRIVDPVPGGAHAPDAPVPAADAAAPGLAMPAFLGDHPVTGKQVRAAGSAKMVATSALTGTIARGQAGVRSRSTRRGAVSPVRPRGRHRERLGSLWLLRRRLDARRLGRHHGEERFQETPFSGYYIGRDRV